MSFGLDDVCLCRDEWDLCKNDQPLLLVGRGLGTIVVDKFFLKATEKLLTSPTEVGPFVRNVRGVTLYGDTNSNPEIYKIEKFFGGNMEQSNRWRSTHTNLHYGCITQGSMLINPEIYGKNLTRDVRMYSTYSNSESSCALMTLMFSFLCRPQHLRGSI